MAVVDDRGHSDDHSHSAPGEDFGRQPPHDMVAEQSVLGGMLLSKDAIADVLERIRPGDFYRPAHQAVYDAVLDLYSRGEPADPVTVSAVLDKRSELKRIGGVAYLVTLTQTVPTAANAGYYAEIVAEKAILRRLVEAGTRIVQYGYAGADGQDVAEIVDRAQAEVYEVTERRTAEDFVVLEELLQPTMDEIDSIASRGGLSLGVPTGFTELDDVTNGLHPGQMIIVAARPGVGKALALDTPLATPTGWTTMGEVAVGDRLLDSYGRPTTVVAATPVMRGRPCYELEFSDGARIVADGSHQWRTETRPGRHCGVRTAIHSTAELADAAAVTRHWIRNTEPLNLPERELPVPPYTLGAWLGDESSTFHTAAPEPEVLARIEGENDVDLKSVRMRLGAIDPRRDRLPSDYLRASEAQRRALLAGLLDTQGEVSPCGSVQFYTTSEQLSRDVEELLIGLGYHVKAHAHTGFCPTYTLTFVCDDAVFGVHRKAWLHKQRHAVRNTGRPNLRHIAGVRRVESVPVRCVEVDNSAHLYLAGRAMVPTHNSTLTMDFMRSCSIRHGMASVIFSLEMGRTEIVMRLLSAEAKIKLGDMRSGRMSDDDWTRLARRMSEISEAPLFVDDSPNLTMMEIRAKARRLKQRHDLRLIVVDYLQLMTSGKKTESRQQEVSEFSRSLKLMAKELEVPVVAVSQLNRGPEQRTDKRPQVSDLRESGCLTESTKVLRADTGSEVTLGELLASGERPLVWSLDERMRMVARPMSAVFPSGRKQVFRLRLASGRTVEASGNHPFLTVDGWIPLENLTVGDRLAIPHQVPEPVDARRLPEAEVILLAHMIGDGSCVRRRPIRHTGVPTPIFSLPNDQIALFLSHLWAGHGSVCWDEIGRQARVYYASTSRTLVHDVAHLLTRVGIHSRIGRVRKAGYRDSWWVTVEGSENQTIFLRGVGVHGAQGATARSTLGQLTATTHNANVDAIPKEVTSRVRGLLAAKQMTHGQFSAAMGSRFCGSAIWKHSPSRARLARVAAVLDDAHIDMLGTNDVSWDQVLEIAGLGEQDVYDATVPGTHNFVANGIAVHNSLEQDADMVILLHRPDAFERDDPRGGEADLILGKHRNGPTATITVAHQLHLSRFVDMARG